MRDRPARRSASGRCCGGARGGASAPRHQRRPAPGDGGRRRKSPHAASRAARRGATGGSRRYAVRTLSTYQQFARADSGAFHSRPAAPPLPSGEAGRRSTRPGASWRCATAGGRRRPGLSTGAASPSASPAGGGRRFSNRTRRKRPFRAARPFGRAGVGSARLARPSKRRATPKFFSLGN